MATKKQRKARRGAKAVRAAKARKGKPAKAAQRNGKPAKAVKPPQRKPQPTSQAVEPELPLSTAQAVELYNTHRDLTMGGKICEKTLRYHVRQGNLRSRKIGTVLTFTRADVIAFAEKNRSVGRPVGEF